LNKTLDYLTLMKSFKNICCEQFVYVLIVCSTFSSDSVTVWRATDSWQRWADRRQQCETARSRSCLLLQERICQNPRGIPHLSAGWWRGSVGRRGDGLWSVGIFRHSGKPRLVSTTHYTVNTRLVSTTHYTVNTRLVSTTHYTVNTRLVSTTHYTVNT